jgi:hypothetical protein
MLRKQLSVSPIGKDVKPTDDLCSRSNIKSISEFMVVTWDSGSETNVLIKVHAAQKWCRVIFTALALSSRATQDPQSPGEVAH